MLSLFVRTSLLGICLSSGIVTLGQEIARNDPPAITLATAATVATHATETAEVAATAPLTLDVVFSDPQEFTRPGEHWSAPYSSRVVIYEDMALKIASNGDYSLTYKIEVPRTDVGILLRFKLPYNDSSPSAISETRGVPMQEAAADPTAATASESNLPAYPCPPHRKSRQATVSIPFTRISGSLDAADKPTRVYTVTHHGNSATLKRYYLAVFETLPPDKQIFVSVLGHDPSAVPLPGYTATIIIGALPR